MSRKQITLQRRAKRDAKKRSAARNMAGKRNAEPEQATGNGENSNETAEKHSSGAKARVAPQRLTARLKSRPFKTNNLSAPDLFREKHFPPASPEFPSSSAARESRSAKIRSAAAQSSAPQLVEIEKPIYGGSFLTRVAGKAVFVPLALPGEQVLVRITQSKSGYATAETEEIIRAAPERMAAACPHFGLCGGCCYQHTDYQTQLAFKQAILRETLERGGVVVPAEIDVLSGEPWRYRNRIRLAFDAAGNLGYRGRKSHGVVPVRECPIAAPLLVEAAQAFAQVIREFAPKLRPMEMALFCNAAETALLATLFLTGPAKLHFDALARALQERVPALTGAELVVEGRPGQQPRTLAQWGAASLSYHAAGFDYRVDHGAFFQVNRWLVDSLVERVVAQHRGRLAWDLFAGVGLFARQLATRFDRVVAVESAPSATAALAANLHDAGGAAVKAEALAFLHQTHANEHPDLVVVDPPRTGLGAGTCAQLARIAAPAVACVSCDPATLARDLRALIASGYVIQSITLADLFPQTFHMETLVQLRRA